MSTTKNWEERFMEQFPHYVPDSWPKIKTFIAKEIQEAEARGREKAVDYILERLDAIQLVSLTETYESEFGMVQGPSPMVMTAYNEALKSAADEVRAARNGEA